MTSYDNTNRGAAWGNKEKTKDTQPDLKGSINVEGKDYWVSVWKRKADANPAAPAISFALTEKENQAVEPPAEPVADTNLDDDIPF